MPRLKSILYSPNMPAKDEDVYHPYDYDEIQGDHDQNDDRDILFIQ